MDRLLTQQDLAERWQVTTRSIDNWRNEGIIQPCKGLPVIRFSPQHIAELEGVKLDKLSPLERKRMENEIERLKRENEELRAIVGKIMAEILKVMGGEIHERATETV